MIEGLKEGVKAVVRGLKTQLPETTAWQEYQAGIEYNNRIGAYTNIDKNYRFYVGKHWEGLNANGLPTPVFNFLRRVVDFDVSSIASEPVTMRYTAWNDENDPFIDALNGHARNRWESLKMDMMLRESLREAAVSGSAVAYTYWDAEQEVGSSGGVAPVVDDEGIPKYHEDGTMMEEPVEIEGDFCTVLLPITHLFLADPQCSDINRNGKPVQDYVLLTGRTSAMALIDEAKEYGGEPDKISPDDDYIYSAGDTSKVELTTARKATYINRFWYDKKTRTIWNAKYTRSALVRKPYDTGLKLYPVSLLNWIPKKGTYHGASPIEEMIPNQIVVNKLHAIMSRWTMDSAFGKIAYDSSRIANWTNKVGVAIKVDGSLDNAVQQILPAQINPIVVQLFDRTIDRSFEVMGVNDVILGNIRPENAAAIIAIQQSSAVPLENTKAAYYQFIEDIGSIWLDFMTSKYDIPRPINYVKDNNPQADMLNMMDKPKDTRVKIDVGASSHWSQLASVQTLDNLLHAGYITLEQYLERVPTGYVPKQEQLKKEIKDNPPPAVAQQMIQAAQAAQAANPQAPAAPPEGMPQGMPPEMAPPEAGQEAPPQAPPEDMIMEFYNSLPPELQGRIQELPVEEQAQALSEMFAGHQNIV
jgi:hypothetical protein